MPEKNIYLNELPEPLPEDPMLVLDGWLAHATALAITPNPNSMTLATLDASTTPARPDARVVLCKALDPGPGTLVFYTNYHSAKGRQLDNLARATAVFHWDSLELQARVAGPVTRTSGAESDEYFGSRPLISRLGAWASKQSQPVSSRAELIRQLRDIEARFEVDDPLDDTQERAIPRPAHWGGYRLWADEVELWIGQRGRLHERARWQRKLASDGSDGYRGGAWQARRLQP